MINIIHIIVKILNTIAITFINLVTTPIKLVLQNSIPNFQTYFQQTYVFLTSYVLKGFHFVKMVVTNLFGIDTNVWLLFIGSLGIMASLYVSFLGLRLGLNIWKTFQGTNGK